MAVEETPTPVAVRYSAGLGRVFAQGYTDHRLGQAMTFMSDAPMLRFLLEPVKASGFRIVCARTIRDHRHLVGVRPGAPARNAEDRLRGLLAHKLGNLFDVGPWQPAGVRYELLVRQIPGVAILNARARAQ